MHALSRGAARCSIRIALLLPSLALASGCESPGLAPRYRSLASELTRASASPPPDESDDENPFAKAESLDRDSLVAEVLRRNPGLAAARETWRSGLARFSQATALEDPTLGYTVGPASLGGSSVDEAHRVELRQAFPFPGKRTLRGEVALADAEASAHDFAAARLRLATMASLLYDEYYLAARALEVNDHHHDLLGEFHAVAAARYEAGEVSAQGPLRAEFERADLERERATLEADALQVRARLNALLHRHPELPLPPPPAELASVPPGSFDRRAAVAAALAAHPELRAADARVRAGEAAVDLARRNFLPDFALTAGYDGFWEVSELRPMLGIELNVPLQLGRRRSALEEARAELERARREREGLESEIRLAVETGAERVEEAGRVLAIYRDRLLPVALDQLEAARAAFETGQESFLAVLAAEEDLREVELGEHRALAALDRSQLELQSATGVLPQR
jgi:outer membrane protein TolC